MTVCAAWALNLFLAVSASGLEASVAEGPWLAAASVSPLAGQRVRLRVAPIAGARIRWFQRIPDVSRMYKNANFPWDPEPYKWVGLAEVRADDEELTRFAGRWEIEPFPAGRRVAKGEWTASYVSDIARSPYYNPSTGSFWFQAEVEKDGKIERFPPGGFRVSVREGPDFIGLLASYQNVPGVFGSLTAQATNYRGVDCADAVTAAWGKWTGDELSENLNVAALLTRFPHAAEFDWGEGGSTRPVRWGSEVRRGDLIAVRYKGALSFQHVGALVGDQDGDGLLSPADLVLHAGPMPLAYAAISEPAFHGRIIALRPTPHIREHPLNFSAARLAATREYIRAHYKEDRPAGRIEPRMVVLHWTGADSLQSGFKTFEPETLAGGRLDIAGGGVLNVSAHFLVDKDGTIYRLMPETLMARHVIGLNLVAVGIENVGGSSDRDSLTGPQAAANAWLVRYLKEEFPAIEYLIGHHEYQAFEGTPLWRESDPGYRTQKQDPGERFMAEVRAKVVDLGLKGAPPL